MCLPCPVHRATAEATPYSRSSGCATIATARSQSSAIGCMDYCLSVYMASWLTFWPLGSPDTSEGPDDLSLSLDASPGSEVKRSDSDRQARGDWLPHHRRRGAGRSCEMQSCEAPKSARR